MRHETGRAPRSDLEIVRDALVDEEMIAHMRDWRLWLSAALAIAGAFAWLRIAAWAVTGL